ncbi:MAG TPA: UbiX family flavin prenyltransferase [Nitrososphaeraceae archaeon]|nr:UbiX family flavin prenyltransferase [Nitrososphaeraceae archaeon]
MKLIVGITGGSGVIYGIKFLEALYELNVESHLVISEWGEKTIRIETSFTTEYVKSLASRNYDSHNMASEISSGSFISDGMVIIPCSMKTLSSIANGYDDNLISRAADVCLKETRRLVIVPRETPLSRIHLVNMLQLNKSGAVILPAMPGFYHKPKSVDDLVNYIVGKVLDQFSIPNNSFKRWARP